ncbi:hypothetical protein CYY_003880 [Polysphondylium violaceum]|uniref:Nucleolar complex protein 3 homolog n=1 Tax=Polysphondylium violaceum TaxID=133409 RepID=A0A8J4Q6A6_9MYCE|nr:hypothetical protein CYY_003880 [Polysphondylium violaceum]
MAPTTITKGKGNVPGKKRELNRQKQELLTIKELTKFDILFREGEKDRNAVDKTVVAGQDELESDDDDFFTNSSFANSNISDASFRKLSLKKQMEKEGVDPSSLLKRKSFHSDSEDDQESEEDSDDDADIENAIEDQDIIRESQWDNQSVVKRKLPLKAYDGKVKTVTEIISAKDYKQGQEIQEQKKEIFKQEVQKDRQAKNDLKKKLKEQRQPNNNEISKQVEKNLQKAQPASKKQKQDKQDSDDEDFDIQDDELDLENRDLSDLEYDDDEVDQPHIKSEGEVFLEHQQLIDNAKNDLAKISSKVITNPELNIQSLKEIFSICLKTKDMTIKKYSILSLCALFKDIIPGYRISKDLQEQSTPSNASKKDAAKLSKDMKKVREYEKKLLKYYQNYLVLIENSINNILALLQHKRPSGGGLGFFKINGGYTGRDLKSLLQCIIKSVTILLVSHPHFNFRTNLVTITARFTVFKEDDIAMMALESVKSLFLNDSTGGETSLEMVRCLANVAKSAGYIIDPKVIRVFIAIHLTDVVEKINPFGAATDDTWKVDKKDRKHLTRTEKKKRKEDKALDKEMKEAEAEYSMKEQRYLQTEILKSIFILYFRIIKKAPQSPALSSVLEGLAKFSHLISVDFLGDLLKVLSDLMENGITSIKNALNTNITAFKTIKLHGNTLNVDLKDYYVKVYSLLTDMVLPKENANVETALDAINMMFYDRKQTSIERVAAYVKRLSTVSLFLPPHAALSVVTLCQQLFVTYPKAQRLLETDHTYAGGEYVFDTLDPDHCNPFASTVWELTLLFNHWHPKFEPLAKRFLAMNEDTINKQLTKERSPLEVFRAYDNTKGGFNPAIQTPKEHPLEAKLKKLKKSYKNKEVTVFIQPQKQYEKSSFLKDMERSVADKKVFDSSLSFAGYYHEINEYNTQMKLHKKIQSLQSIKQKLDSKQKELNSKVSQKPVSPVATAAPKLNSSKPAATPQSKPAASKPATTPKSKPAASKPVATAAKKK